MEFLLFLSFEKENTIMILIMTMTIVMMMLMMLTTMINSDRRMQQLYEYVPAYVSTRNTWYCLQCYAVVLPFESGQSLKQLLLVK